MSGRGPGGRCGGCCICPSGAHTGGEYTRWAASAAPAAAPFGLDSHQMDSPDWLRTQLTTFTCPACGRRYRGSKMRLLAEREGLFFVDLDCSRCGSHTVAIVTVEIDDSEVTIEVSDVVGEGEIEHLGEPPRRG